MSVAQVGLVLLYAAQLQRAVMGYMMNTADLEKQFVSVERVAEYMRLEAEEDDDADASEMQPSQPSHLPKACPMAPPVDWPHNSEISLLGVHLRYRFYRPLVLTGVHLQIPAGAKVAVCGRTGCGKSTLFAVLSRLYPLVSGQVMIGGRD